MSSTNTDDWRASLREYLYGGHKPESVEGINHALQTEFGQAVVAQVTSDVGHYVSDTGPEFFAAGFINLFTEQLPDDPDPDTPVHCHIPYHLVVDGYMDRLGDGTPWRVWMVLRARISELTSGFWMRQWS